MTYESSPNIIIINIIMYKLKKFQRIPHWLCLSLLCSWVRTSWIMSIIVQRDATIYSFIIFLQTALHISDDILIHHQEHIQTVITSSDTVRTIFATVRCRAGVVPTPPRQRTVANTVRPVPDAVITVWVCSWWWMRISSKTCRAVCRNIIKQYIVASCWTIIDIVLTFWRNVERSNSSVKNLEMLTAWPSRCRYYKLSKHQEPLTQWYNIIYHTNQILTN
jgi:hypothetical protein